MDQANSPYGSQRAHLSQVCNIGTSLFYDSETDNPFHELKLKQAKQKSDANNPENKSAEKIMKNGAQSSTKEFFPDSSNPSDADFLSVPVPSSLGYFWSNVATAVDEVCHININIFNHNEIGERVLKKGKTAKFEPKPPVPSLRHDQTLALVQEALSLQQPGCSVTMQKGSPFLKTSAKEECADPNGGFFSWFS